jgi:hypothetical protein
MPCFAVANVGIVTVVVVVAGFCCWRRRQRCDCFHCGPLSDGADLRHKRIAPLLFFLVRFF